MKKTQKKVLKKSEEVQYNPNEFGYRPGQKIEVDAELLQIIMRVLNVIIMQESTIVYSKKENMEATLKTAQEQVTDEGLQAIQLSNIILQLHLENIKNKVAIPTAQLQKEMEAKTKKEPATKEAKPELKLVPEQQE